MFYKTSHIFKPCWDTKVCDQKNRYFKHLKNIIWAIWATQSIIITHLRETSETKKTNILSHEKATWARTFPLGQTIHACTRFSPSEVPSALADERSWCDGDRSFAVCSGWSCLGFLISLCHCIPVGEGTYTQGKSVNTNLICMEKVTVISSDSKSLWATQQHKESLPPILLSNPDIKLLWPSRKLPLRGLSLSTVVSAASRAASARMHVIKMGLVI